MSKLSVDEVKQFFKSADKSRADYLEIAKRSWNEIKRRLPDGKLRSFDVDRKRGKYPLWYNIWKIRQSIVYCKLGTPIAKDTSETGNDSIGASAAFFKERLAINLAKDDDPKETMFAARDDLLATDVCWIRGYYEKEDVKDKVKEYLTSQVDPATGAVAWFDQSGNPYKGDDFQQDETGMFTYLDRTVDVTNEKAHLEHILYKYVYVDPDIKRWNRCRRLGFEIYFSVPEFKDLFGAKAYDELALAEREKGNADFEKTQNLKILEYWDYYTKETVWLHDSSTKFLEPKTEYFPHEDEEGYLDSSCGILNLPQFFPCCKPRVRNASTDNFWPTPEFYQFMDVFLDIDNLFTRMMAVTRIMRAKLFYDDDVDAVHTGLQLMSDTEVIGVPNLTKVLAGAGGSINNVAQYLDISSLAAVLEGLYKALEQRLATVYRMTGTNDLLQGLSSDNSGKTLGERQMEQRYSLSQLEELQSMMAELDRDAHQLRCDIALRNFKDESLIKYMMPETAPENHQRNFRAALTLLKENNQRFRLELETDSTIAINEQYDKQVRKELVDAMTQGLQGVAEMADTRPELVKLSLEAMKYYIQGFRGSKIFQEEISATIDNVIESIQEAAENAPPPFDKDQFDAQLAQMKLQQDGQLAQMKLESEQLIASAELAQNERLAGLEAQVEQMKMEASAGKAAADNQIKLQQIQVDYQVAMENLAANREKMMIEVQSIADESQREQLKLMIQAQYNQAEIQLKQQQQRLEETYGMLELQERIATEQRLQGEDDWNVASKQVDIARGVQEMALGVEKLAHEKEVKTRELELKDKEIETKKVIAKSKPKPVKKK